MPKGYLRDREYKASFLGRYIFSEMREQKYTQEQMAQRLGMQRQTFSRKCREGELTAYELITVFQELKTDAETIGKLLKV